MNEFLSLAFLSAAVFNVVALPLLLLWGQHRIDRRLDRVESRLLGIELDVEDIAVILDIGPSDDPDDGEDLPDEPSNVIAIGRRAA